MRKPQRNPVYRNPLYQALFTILGQEISASRPEYAKNLIKPMENQAFQLLKKRQEAENLIKPIENEAFWRLEKRQEAENLMKSMEKRYKTKQKS